MNLFKGSRTLIVLFLLPFTFHHAIPNPVKWIWSTLVVLVALKRFGIINVGFVHASQSKKDSAASKPSAFSHSSAARSESRHIPTHQGEIVAHGSAPYMFDKANRLLLHHAAF